MQKKDRAVTDMKEIIKIVDKCDVIRLGLWDGEEVYIVPMNFGYTYEEKTLTFYVHGAVKGRKNDILKENPKVGFEMECDVIPFEGKKACQNGTSFSSIIGKGVAEFIEDPQEKIKALNHLMMHCSGKEFEFTERMVTIVNVFKITATAFEAKHRPLPAVLRQEV